MTRRILSSERSIAEGGYFLVQFSDEESAAYALWRKVSVGAHLHIDEFGDLYPEDGSWDTAPWAKGVQLLPITDQSTDACIMFALHTEGCGWTEFAERIWERETGRLVG